MCIRDRSYTYISLNLSRIASSESPLRLPDRRMRTVLISFSLAKSHAASGPMVDVSYFCGRIFSISRLSHQRSNAEADWVSASAAPLYSVVSVSYTHLDVYKRQGNAFSIQLTAQDDLSLGDVTGQVGDRVGLIVFGHGQNRDCLLYTSRCV